MQTQQDEYSGRPIAEDAYPPLKAFRDAGARSFHNFTVDQVREMYVQSCESAPLDEELEPTQSDFEVAQFRVRLYDPRPADQRRKPTPAILFLHGGGWVMGNLRTHHFAARRVAARSGFPVLAVDYRLAPEHQYPAAIEDCRYALTWFFDSTQPHGINVSTLSLIGDSAGGQLAAILANEFSDKFHLDSQVLLYPVTDLSAENITDSASYQRMTAGFPLVSDTMKWFADNYVEAGEHRRNEDLSPIFADLPESLPPSYVITVDNDPLADEGSRYADKLRLAGIPTVHDHLVGYAHGLFTSAGKIPTGEKYLNKAVDFIIENASKQSD